MNEIQKYQNVLAMTPQDLAAHYNPTETIKRAKSITTDLQAFESEFPKMALFKVRNGIESLQALIVLHLMNLQNEMNLNRQASKEACYAMAEDLLDVPNFINGISLEEMTYFFRKCRKGAFGTTYQGLSSEFMVTAAMEYISTRLEYKGRQSEDNHRETIGYIEDRKPEKHKSESVSELYEQIALRDQVNGLKK